MLVCPSSNNIIMTNQELEQQDCYLQCKICHKDFPKFDQRGFRNAGFTAHQNRCIEKEHKSNQPSLSQSPLIPKQRLLLPAPSNPLSSINIIVPKSFNDHATPVLSNDSFSSSYDQNTEQFYPDYFANLHSPTTLIMMDNHQYFSASPTTLFQMDQQQQQEQPRSNIPVTDISNAKFIHAMVYPINCCNYCSPYNGLHQPYCEFLIEFLNRAPL